MEGTSQHEGQGANPYEELMQNWRQEIPAQLNWPVESFAQKHLIYGTAWKGEQTAELVYQAIKAGFRAIATASQPLHYREDLVGLGVRRAIDEGIVKREELFVSGPYFPLRAFLMQLLSQERCRHCSRAPC